jgi:hypothetical protein
MITAIVVEAVDLSAVTGSLITFAQAVLAISVQDCKLNDAAVGGSSRHQAFPSGRCDSGARLTSRPVGF